MLIGLPLVSNVSTIIIQCIGRWSSEAFLEYTRKQVENFTQGVSQFFLDIEYFFVLGRQNNPSAPETSIINTQDYKNGPVEVPLNVFFSNLAIEDSASLTRSQGMK